MESLAVVLRRIPIFQHLPPGSFAKIIADLRAESYPAGAVICYEGEDATDFYIIRSGTVAVFVNRGGNQRELVAVNGPNEWFGERALFSDLPRSATVVARSPVELWRLTKEKFDGLIEENPYLILHFMQVISDRLYHGNRELSEMQAAFTAQMESLFRAQPEERQRFLLRTSILSRIDADVAHVLVDDAAIEQHMQAIGEAGAFVMRRDSGLVYFDSVRTFLQAKLAQEIGTEGIRQLHLHAARYFEQQEQWEQAVDSFLSADEHESAAAIVAKQFDNLLGQKRFDLLRRWLDGLPDSSVAEYLPDASHDLEHAMPHARRRARKARKDSAPVALLNRALPWLGAVLGVGVGLAFWLSEPPAGLSVEGMHMLALLAWAAVFWAFDVLPDYVVGLGLIIGWIVLGIVPIDVAVSGFTTSPFFLIIGVLGIGASLQASGLLFRLALQILRRFPLTHRGQSLGLALSGTAITSGIPDVTSGVAIASPIILALSDSLGYSRRSNGSAGLAMAAVLGFGQMSPFFMTGAAENLLAWGLLPDDARAQITWMGWLLAALPLALVTFGLAFTATMLLLPPETQPTVSRQLIETQIEALGPLSPAELINGLVLLGALIGWVTAPYHSVDVAWVAMSGLGILLAANLLDRTTFRSGIYWDFLFYLGAVLSLTGVVRHLHVDTWLIELLTPVLAPMTEHPNLFLIFVAVAIFAARFILPSFPLVSMLVITLAPIAIPAGISALVLVLVICTTVAVWFLPYQSTYYLALYFGTKEKAFSHGQVRLLAWSYGVIYLVAIVVALPYWHYLGLLP